MGTLRFAPVLALAMAAAACSSGDTSAPASNGQPGPAGTADPAPAAPKKPTDDNGPMSTQFIDPTIDPHAKPCVGAPGSLYALSPKKLTAGNAVPLCRFDGSVLLIVNVASFCRNTPQYAPLETLYEKYRAQGFYVLAFPSPQFGDQEFKTEPEVTAYCTSTYHITFPMFSIGDVNGPSMQPVYSWLHSQPGGPPPDGYARDVQWNFEKFLIDRQGKLVQRIEQDVMPDDPAVVTAIEAQLAKK